MSLEKELEKLFDDPLLKNVEDEDLSLFVIPEYLNKKTKARRAFSSWLFNRATT